MWSGDDERAEICVKEIASLGLPALPELARFAHDQDPEKRWWALRTIAEIPSDTSTDILINALDDPEPGIRHCAALGIRMNPHHKAVPGLAAALQDKDLLLAALAADALIEIGPQAVPTLIDLVERDTSNVTAEAVRALAFIADSRAVPILFQLMDSDSMLKAHWAEEGLERMGIGMTFFAP